MSAVPLPSVSPVLERLRTLFASRTVRAPDLQQPALDSFLAQGLPTARDEAWKYTPLRRFESRTLALADPLAAVDTELTARQLPGDGWQRLVFVNGRFSAAQSSALGMQPGLRIRTLQSVLQESPEETASLLGMEAADPSARFALLNRAFLEDGLVIEVEAGVTVAMPVYIALLTTSSSQRWLVSPRIIVRAAAASRVTLVEHYLSAERAEHVVNAVTQVAAVDGAIVEHYRLQQEGSQVIHLGHVNASVGRNARYESHTLALGSSLGRLDLVARLEGTQAHAALNGIFLANGSQHLDTRTCLEHAVPHTTSTEDYRGLADGRGRGVFNGKVIVHKDAQKTDARQSSRNLLLSPTAEIDTRPELEIYADDVKCSHGATTGQLDPVALFYLRSRGIDEAEARGLLALAFVEAVMGHMSLEPVRTHLHGIFARHFLVHPEASA